MAEPLDAAIIGGGISGLACARRLCDAKASFRLITDHLGGRMYHSADGSMNFGATYVNRDYHRVLPYVGLQARFHVGEAHFQQSDGLARLFCWRNVQSLRPILRVIWRLQEYRRALTAFRETAELMPQAEARLRHPLIDRYSRQPAPELIRQWGLDAVDEGYAGPTFRTTAFAEPEQSSALFYLGSLLPLVVPTWVADFSHTYRRLTAGYQDRIVRDRVVGLRRIAGGRFEVQTASGPAYVARSVVIAVPHADASPFYPVPKPHLTTSAMVLFVRGQRRPEYQGKRFVAFVSPPAGIVSIWDQGHGWDQVYSLSTQPDLTTVYLSFEVLQTVSWRTAIVLSDEHWAPAVLEPNLYLAGDYNLCGLEDSLITGLCAANHILQRTELAAEKRPRAYFGSPSTVPAVNANLA
jgi:hypothetical protein